MTDFGHPASQDKAFKVLFLISANQKMGHSFSSEKHVQQGQDMRGAGRHEENNEGGGDGGRVGFREGNVAYTEALIHSCTLLKH